jgi:hypothetical protein
LCDLDLTEMTVDSPPKVVAGLAMKLAGFVTLLIGGMLLPGKAGRSCTVERVAAHLCSPSEHQAENYGLVLLCIGALIFYLGWYFDRTGRQA